MGSHPINLAVRFLLELSALGIMAYWGWTQGEGMFRYVLTIGIPVIAAVAWGTLAVPDDPSRSGQAPVPVPGAVRLALELAIFGFATWALYSSGLTLVSLMYGAIVVIHYLISYDRVLWLVRS